jgi:hypothetical protein
MKESGNVIEHVNRLAIIAKELVALWDLIPDMIQVSTILYNLFSSWE